MLEELVRKGRFREDLYWRLNVIKISIPPLRERREDIPLLVEHFCKKFSEEQGHMVDVEQSAMQILISYDWPGNVRELENEIRKAAVLGDGIIKGANLSPRILDSVQGRKYSPFALRPQGTLKTAVEQFEKEYLLHVLEECGGNRAEAARRLRIGRRTLYDKLTRYGIAEEEK
jgi:DNA-binding NtrC family response regulator